MKRRRALLFTITVVLALCVACGLWLHIRQRQYALNRQLIAALEHNDTTRALALVNAGADPSTRYAPSPTPTFLWLLSHLLHPSRPTADTSPTALISACGTCRFSNDVSLYPHGRRYTWERHPYYEDLALVQAMLLHSADTHARYVQQDSALFAAVQANRVRTVEMLLKHGANINTQEKDGETPLMEAVQMDSPEMVKLLLSHGANVNAQDEGCSTALHCCVAAYSAENILQQLLRRGANPNVSNRLGVTPCQMAQQKQCFDVVRRLKQYGAK